MHCTVSNEWQHSTVAKDPADTSQLDTHLHCVNVNVLGFNSANHFVKIVGGFCADVCYIDKIDVC